MCTQARCALLCLHELSLSLAAAGVACFHTKYVSMFHRCSSHHMQPTWLVTRCATTQVLRPLWGCMHLPLSIISCNSCVGQDLLAFSVALSSSGCYCSLCQVSCSAFRGQQRRGFVGVLSIYVGNIYWGHTHECSCRQWRLGKHQSSSQISNSLQRKQMMLPAAD